jgi:transcription elongation factor Elf1
MSNRPNRLISILGYKCPRCRKGNIFTNSGFHIKFGRRANVYCPVCNLRFEREPGFFEGGMYFNYALNLEYKYVFK